MKNIKTVREHLLELPKIYAEKAIQITNTNTLESEADELLSETLLGAFIWKNTSQSHNYWEKLYRKLVRKENEKTNS